MKVIAYDPFLSEKAKADAAVELVSFDEMLSRADAISIHVPRTQETAGMFDDAAFDRVRPGVLIVNAARGGVVDEAALLRALDDGRVAGAAVDVFEQEPPGADHPLVRHENVICTPHLGASTEQAQVNVAIAVAEQVRDYLVDGIVGNALNMPSVSKELYRQIRPYLELAVKLGRFQGQLCPGSIDRVEIEYSGDAAALEVAPITVSLLKGLLESVTDQVNLVNAPIIAREHGITVIESKTSHSRDFASAIAIRVIGCVDRYIVGAIFHGDQPRIVRIDDFMLEAIPEGPTLLILNRDQPGVVGAVGTVLGEGGINISRMQLGLVPERSEAAMLVNIDRAPDGAVMERLRRLPHMISAQLIELGP
jgi:D-3-phosphoglycerate dehydrogenase